MRRARMGGGYSDAHAILAEETAMPVRFNTASAGACLASCHLQTAPASTMATSLA